MTFLLAIAAIVGLIWATVFLLRGSTVAGCLLFLLAGCCFGHHWLHFDLGPLPLTVDRLVLGAAPGAYIIQRQWRQTDSKPMQLVDWLLLAFVALLSVSTLFGDHPWHGTAFDPVPPVWRLAGAYLFPLAIYWLMRQSKVGPRQARWVTGFLIVFGLYLAITALFEVNRAWAFVYPRYISDPNIGLHFGRARGPMVQSVSLGLYLGICLIALAAYAWTCSPRGKLLLCGIAPLFAAGIFFTYTRTVWLGAALGLLTVFALVAHGRWRIVGLGAVVAAGLLVSVVKLDSLLGFEREGSAAETRNSASMRLSFAYVSWLMFLDRPVLGHGFGQFPTAKLPYLDDRSVDLQLGAIREYAHHNTYLSLLTEVGLIGLGLFLAIVALWAWNAWKLWGNRTAPAWARAQGLLLLGTLPIYGLQALGHDLTYTPLDNSLLFLLAGLTAALRPIAEGQTASAEAPKDGLPAVAAA
jgi:O-antigen ligase